MDLMEYLESAEKSLFRWEALQEYKVDGEDEGMDEWWEFIERKTRNGVAMERVRLIVFPMNDYTKKEVEVHKLSATHGDTIRFVDVRDMDDAYPSCFWLIDDSLVLKMNYGPNGEYYGFETEENIQPFLDFKEKILKQSRSVTEL